MGGAVDAVHKRDAAIRSAFASLAKRTDDMERITWFEDKLAKNASENVVKFYFGKFSDSRFGPLRMLVRYRGRDWLFANEMVFKVDGQIYCASGCSSWDHQVLSGGVAESCDFPVSQDEPSLTMALAQAREVKVRLTGKRYRDWIVAPGQLAAIKRIAAAWTIAKEP